MELESVMAIPKQGPVIAIDGPAGTGKSSVTKRLCQNLGYIHVDTGALYRCIAFECLNQKIFPGPLTADPATRTFDESINEKITLIARDAHIEFKVDADRNPSNRVFLNGSDVSDSIRTPEVSLGASAVSSISGVRASLLGQQRRLGCVGHSILEGRDIGTVIFPDADIKFFMTASVEVRAKRRLSELEASDANVPSFEEIKQQIADRDRADSTRKEAPLKKAQGSIEIDTTSMSLDQVVDHMLSIVREKVKSE